MMQTWTTNFALPGVDSLTAGGILSTSLPFSGSRRAASSSTEHHRPGAWSIGLVRLVRQQEPAVSKSQQGFLPFFNSGA